MAFAPREVAACCWAIPPLTLRRAGYVVADTPHAWLLPRTAAVSTTAASAPPARACASNVVCPWFADQLFWAERVHALGAGPRPVPARRLTAQAPGDAIAQAVGDTATCAWL
jgi:hypothetical protein